MAATSVFLIVSVLVGAALQRVAGMGFAMVVAPFALLLLPDQQGVVLANLLGALTGLALILPVRKDVDWPRVAVLSGTSVAGAVAGAVAIRALDPGSFRIVVGIMLVIAIIMSLLVGRTNWVAPTVPSTISAGVGTGMLVTMSGIGGPPMTVYSVLTRWEHRIFAASMQPFVVVSSAIGAAAALAASPASFPRLSASIWIALVAALFIGLVAGRQLDRVVPPRVGRFLVVLLGIAGGLTAVASGLSMIQH